MLGKWLATRKKNFATLRSLAERIGKEFESMPYDALRDPTQPVSYEREIDGIRLTWTADVLETKSNGDIWFDIAFRAELPTVFGVMPTYSFYKRRDGTVYHK